MLEIEDAARLAKSLPSVTEHEHRDRLAWKVGGRTFAWERPFTKADIKRFADTPVPQGPILALVTDGLSEKQALLQQHPTYLFNIAHFDNYPGVLLQLCNAQENQLARALEEAWMVHAPLEVAKSYLARPKGFEPLTF